MTTKILVAAALVVLAKFLLPIGVGIHAWVW